MLLNTVGYDEAAAEIDVLSHSQMVAETLTKVERHETGRRVTGADRELAEAMIEQGESVGRAVAVLLELRSVEDAQKLLDAMEQATTRAADQLTPRQSTQEAIREVLNNCSPAYREIDDARLKGAQAASEARVRADVAGAADDTPREETSTQWRRVAHKLDVKCSWADAVASLQPCVNPVQRRNNR